MAPKKETHKNKMKNKTVRHCGIYSPGPIYGFKPLVGYKDHCLSRLRNPQYTFGIKPRERIKECSAGPYDAPPLKSLGFTFGRAVKSEPKSCTPGPYDVKFIGHNAPAFTIKFRTKERPTTLTPGPYYKGEKIPGPYFTIGRKPYGKCEYSPGPYDSKVDYIKPRAPEFTIGMKLFRKTKCTTPGPSYLPVRRMGQMSFGIKYNECVNTLRTECDDLC